MSSNRKIQCTKNYRLFGRTDANRPLNLRKHKKLTESMKKYGFLACYPIVVFRDKSGNLFVKDGQHRLAIAETLGLPIYYIEEAADFDITLTNIAQEKWVLKDFAQTFSAQGKSAYREGLDFAELHKLPLGLSFALLAGTTSFNNEQEQFVRGDFKVKDRQWADRVAGIYGPLVTMQPLIKKNTLVEACMAVCRVENFDGQRLIDNANRCREKLVPYSTREAYLDMLEAIYNFGRKQLVGLKAAAIMAMRERNIINSKKRKSKKRSPSSSAAESA